MQLNIGCGPHKARRPWVNVDRVHIPGSIEPDIINPSGSLTDLYAHVEPGSCSHVYLGHVLEHVPWDEVGDFLAGVMRLLAPDGVVCVVCPDIYRTIDGFRDGRYPISLVRATLEDSDDYQAHGVSFDGARHCWNAYEERVVEAMTAAGFADVIGLRPRMLDSVWPLVSPVDWQCAAIGRLP